MERMLFALKASIIEANSYLTQEESLKYIITYAMYTPINMEPEEGVRKKKEFTQNVLNNDLMDIQGTQLGKAMFDAARGGASGEVTYRYQRPTTGSDKEFTKTSLVARVSGILCGVGYYNPE